MVIASKDKLIRNALFVFGSFIVAYNGAIIVHEMGHAANSYLVGGGYSPIVLHPLSWSYTITSEPDHYAYVIWGGLFWSTIVGVIAFLAVWPLRSARTFTVSLWSCLCFVMNGVYYLVGGIAVTGDPESLMDEGVSRILIISIGMACLFMGGLMGVLAGCSLSLRQQGCSLVRTLYILAAPIGAYLIAMLVYAFFWTYEEIALWGGFVGIGLFICLSFAWVVHRLGNRFLPPVSRDITWTSVLVVNTIAGIMVTLEIMTLIE